jgi:hypothetical protein
MKKAPLLIGLLSAALLSGGTAIAATAATPLVMDLVGDGIDLGGQATTSLFGPVQRVHWTKLQSDDAFLVVDATAIRGKGYSLRTQGGAILSGPQLVRGGTRLRPPGGSEVSITEAWQFLGQLDSDKNGRIDASDLAWSDLSLFMDVNADGKLELSELMRVSVSGVASISLAHSAPAQDSHGNSLAKGRYRTASGSTRVAAGATLASAPLVSSY